MTEELQVKPHLYMEYTTKFEKPEIVGFFSLNNEREYISDTSQLKYVKKLQKEKAVSFDLNLKFKEACHKPYHMDDKIKNLLTFLLQNEKRLKLRKQKQLDKSWIYCNRGILRAVSCTPYDLDEEWRLVATLFKGNIYLCMRDTEKKLRTPTERQIKCTAWGHKFEQFLASDSTNSKPQPNEPNDEHPEFNLILESKINDHFLLYGAESDGVLCDNDTKDAPGVDATTEETLQYLRMGESVELKTNQLLTSYNQMGYFKTKVMKWWAQCHLAGIDSLICGYRTYGGVVKKLTPFKMQNLTDMGQGGLWSPQVCINFLDEFLNYTKRCFKEKIIMKHGEHTLLKIDTLPLMWLHFEYNPEKRVVLLTDNYVYEDDPILPQWFVDGFQKTNTCD